MDLAISIKKAIEQKQTDVAAQKITSENVKDLILWKDPLDRNSSLLHAIAENKGVDDMLNTFMQLVKPSDVEAWVTDKNCYGQTCLHVAAINTNGVFLEKLLDGREKQVCGKEFEVYEPSAVSHLFIHSST